MTADQTNAPDPLGWEAGVRSSVALTFDFDAESVWLAENPANENQPGVLSQGRYGARRGLRLILDVLKRHDRHATFFVPGWVAARYPDHVREILGDGHEVGAHGYTHRSPTELDANEELTELRQGREILESLGAEVSGYRSPSWEFSPRTLSILESEGFSYSSNLMDDLWPYRHPGASVVELPVQWILDDAPHFWFSADDWGKKISVPREVLEIWEGEVEGIHKLGGLSVLTFHPQIIGRPGRLPVLEQLLRFLDRLPGAQIAKCCEIAAFADQRLPEPDARGSDHFGPDRKTGPRGQARTDGQGEPA